MPKYPGDKLKTQREIPVSFQDHWYAKISPRFPKLLYFPISLVCEVYLLPWGKYAPNALYTSNRHKLIFDFSSTLQSLWIIKPWKLKIFLYVKILWLPSLTSSLVTLNYSWKFTASDKYIIKLGERWWRVEISHSFFIVSIMQARFGALLKHLPVLFHHRLKGMPGALSPLRPAWASFAWSFI